MNNVDTFHSQKRREVDKFDTVLVSRTEQHSARISCKLCSFYFYWKKVQISFTTVTSSKHYYEILSRGNTRVPVSNKVYLIFTFLVGTHCDSTCIWLLGSLPCISKYLKNMNEIVKTFLRILTLQSCCPWLSSSKGWRVKHFEQAYNIDSFPLIMRASEQLSKYSQKVENKSCNNLKPEFSRREVKKIGLQEDVQPIIVSFRRSVNQPRGSWFVWTNHDALLWQYKRTKMATPWSRKIL